MLGVCTEALMKCWAASRSMAYVRVEPPLLSASGINELMSRQV